MIITVWSVKGGQGTSVVAATMALLLARAQPTLLVDLAGDQPAVLGLPEPIGPGISDWLQAPVPPPDAVGRLEVEARPGLSLLPRGEGELDGQAGPLVAALSSEARAVVVDAGLAHGGPAQAIASAADRSLMVLRPCYLAVRRAARCAVTPTGLVVVRERERALRPADVAQIVGIPVHAIVDWDPAVSRAVDAGLLQSRLPRLLERSLGATA